MAYTDSFTGTDGTALETYNSTWVKVTSGGMTIGSNTLRCTGVPAGYYYNQSFNDKHYAKLKASAGRFIGPAIRVSSGPNFYHVFVRVSGGGSYSYPGECIAGSLADWDSGQPSLVAGDIAELRVDNTTSTTIIYKVNNTTVQTYTGKSTLTGGRAGVAGYASDDPYGDDWEGGNVTTTTTVTVNQVTETSTAQLVKPKNIRLVKQVTETSTAQAVTRFIGARVVQVGKVQEDDLANRVYPLRKTGNVLAASGSSITSGAYSAEPWVTPGAVTADDGTSASITAATFDSPDQSQLLIVKFSMSSVPVNAVIKGVQVTMNTWYANGTVSVSLLQLLDVNGSPVGTNQCATPVALTTTNTATVTKGGSTDLWGNSLTPTWVRDSDFGVAIGMTATGANADVFVDAVWLNVFYIDPLTQSVAMVTSTATVPSIKVVKSRQVNQVVETSTAQVVTHYRPTTTVTVNQVVETSTTTTITRRKFRTIGQAAETDQGTAVRAIHTRALVMVTETDAVFSLSRRKIRTVTQVVETDTANLVIRQGLRVVNQVVETYTLNQVTRRKIRAIGQVVETDAASSVTKRKFKTIAQVTVTNTVTVITHIKRRALVQVVETDTAQVVSTVGRKFITTQMVVETDAVSIVRHVKVRSIGQVSSTNLPQVIQPARVRLIGQAVELDTAQPITRELPTVVAVGMVSEEYSVFIITRLLITSIVDLHLRSRSTFMTLESRDKDLSMHTRVREL